MSGLVGGMLTGLVPAFGGFPLFYRHAEVLRSINFGSTESAAVSVTVNCSPGVRIVVFIIGFAMQRAAVRVFTLSGQAAFLSRWI